MTVLDFFAYIIKIFSPAVVGLVVIAAVIVFIVGFCKRGMDFIKHGFRGVAPESSLEKRLDDIAANMATKDDLTKMDAKMATKEDLGKMATDMNGMSAELQNIKVNHFGHLKNFLAVLTSILLDRGIINNENKAQLDNQLRDM
ncbi:MAG: hypothetical protein LBT01_01975 [Spirochaetaceae bacterium]|jgi:hypothetical protein|nr:hypothetical protein [Spirochaetaceae bacterium]